MTEDYDLIPIQKSDLDNKMRSARDKGWRLVQIHSVSYETYDALTYSVASPENHLVNYRIILKEDEHIDSIGDIFPGAVFYENELKELFGINIDCLSLDYKGKFYDLNVEAPFKIHKAKEGGIKR